jgi:hypothetical protein
VELEAAFLRATQSAEEETQRRAAAEAAVAQLEAAKAAVERQCRELQEAVGDAQGQAAQARRKAEGLARELRLALGGGEDGTTAAAANAAVTPRLIVPAEVARLRVRVGELEAKLEVCVDIFLGG